MKALPVIVTAVVLLLGAHLLLTWLGSRRRMRVQRVGGVAVLRLARGRNVILGLIALIPALILAALPLAMQGSGPLGLAFAAIVALAAFSVSVYFFAAEVRKRIRIDDTAIERVGVFTRRRLRWGDVEKIAYNPTARWFYVVGKDGTRVWIYESFEGVGDFAETALRNVPAAVLAAGLYVRDELEDLAAA